MSDRLLKESDVLKAIDKRIEELSKDPVFIRKNGIIDIIGVKKYILAIPSVDRPKGEWILDPNGMDWNIPAWRCSRCGAKNDNIGVVAKGIASDPYRWAGSKFCPQCGCEMRAKESE